MTRRCESFFIGFEILWWPFFGWKIITFLGRTFLGLTKSKTRVLDFLSNNCISFIYKYNIQWKPIYANSPGLSWSPIRVTKSPRYAGWYLKNIFSHLFWPILGNFAGYMMRLRGWIGETQLRTTFLGSRRGKIGNLPDFDSFLYLCECKCYAFVLIKSLITVEDGISLLCLEKKCSP